MTEEQQKVFRTQHQNLYIVPNTKNIFASNKLFKKCVFKANT